MVANQVQTEFTEKWKSQGAFLAIQWLANRACLSLYKCWRFACRLAGKPFGWVLYFISGWLPRSGTLWLFGTVRNGFSDNAKYLFLYASSQVPGVRPVWISGDPGTISKIKSLGLAAVARWSVFGVWLSLRAKYFFFDWTVSDINFYTSRGATQINLWHGSPLKRIGFDIKVGPLAHLYIKPGWRNKIMDHPDLYVRPSFVLSASRFVSNYSLTSAFQLPVGRCLEFGYPRLDILFGDKEAVISQLRRTKDNEFIALLTHLNSFKRVILYLPTFRDSGEDFLMEAGLDVARIEAICEELDAVFVIKMHQNSPSSSFETKVVTARRILILRSKLDVYPLMVFADLLITDYSSVMFEFILTRKPIVLYAFDLETYVSKCRDLYLPYEELATGVQVETFDELCSALRKLLSGPLKQNYEDGIIERFNRFSDGNASKRICEFVRKIESGKENSD